MECAMPLLHSLVSVLVLTSCLPAPTLSGPAEVPTCPPELQRRRKGRRRELSARVLHFKNHREHLPRHSRL
jgi:hypothetical protein